MRRSHGLAGIAMAVACAGGIYMTVAAEAVPVPAPLVAVKTQSGSVQKTVSVPMGGLPVQIDVDSTGTSTPDVDVAVAMVAAEELPGRPIVPTISVTRSPQALRANTPAPPLRIDFTIDVVDAANDFAPIASVTYGYATPPGGRVPASFRTKLLGPIEAAFIDPLEVAIETPGYEAPLTLNASAKTDALDADFKVTYDPMPSRVHFIEDPRHKDDPAGEGMRFDYDHDGGVTDVELTGTAKLSMEPDWSVRDIAVGVERLPGAITLDYTKLGEGDATIVYTARNAPRKPDIDATYRETSADGVLETDVAVQVAGLPASMRGDLRGTETGGKATLDSAEFKVTDGGQVDSVDFVARNWIGDPGTLPEVDARPGQYIAFASRVADDGARRYRAAGHVKGVRAVRWERVPSGDHNGFDIETDIGDGVRPLRALMDVDDRGPGASEDANHLVVDTTVTPLPQRIHARMVPGEDKEKPMKLLYEASTEADVEADVRVEKGTHSECGDPLVTCAQATIERLPASLGLELLTRPGSTDFTLDRGEGHDPDVRAVVDATGSDPADRKWADIRLDRIPAHVRGRVESATGVVTNAEFHTCSVAFTEEGKCTEPDPTGLGRATFTVRDRPERTDLPARPDVKGHHITLLERDGTDEVSGSVASIRNIAFRQRDRNADGIGDGTIGYLVDAGRAEPFEVHVDSVGPDFDHPAHDRTIKLDAEIDALPSNFRGCQRSAAEVAPAAMPADQLMAPCDTQTVDGREVDSTPLTVYYNAADPLTADVDFDMTGPHEREGGTIEMRTTEVTTRIAKVPQEVRLDAISPIAPGGPEPPRDLSVVYQADAPIDEIDVDFRSRGPADVCSDPRPGRDTLCLKAKLSDTPRKVALTSDPDPAVGTIDVRTAAPDPGDRFDITDLELEMTQPDAKRPLAITADVLGIPQHMTAQVQSLVAPGETDPRLARVHFDACPDNKPSDPECTGIGRITFDARDGFFADALPSPPAATPPPGTIKLPQSLTYVAQGQEFRASGSIADLKEVGFSLLDSTGKISNLTTVNAALDAGAGDWLRMYVNADDGKQHTIVDGVVTDIPNRLDLCLRPQVAEADVHTNSKLWCEGQKATHTALQARFGTSRGGERPDFDVRNLILHRYAGNALLGGSIKVTDMAPRLDVLAGPGPDPEIEMRARTDEGTPQPSPIGRITFALKDHLDLSGLLGEAPPKQFPFAPLDSTTPSPENDPRNEDPDGVPNAGRNYLRVESDPTRLAIKGSVPAIETLAVKPDRCDPDDERFPPRSLFAIGKKPDYICAQAVLGRSRPLSFAVRTLGADGKAIAIDDGNITKLPNGDGGLAATIATAPDTVANAPICDSILDPTTTASCRPPLFSLHSDRLVLTTPPTFTARMAIGPLDHIRELRATSPLDVHSRRLNYERRPADFSLDGARVKTGTWDDGFALRAGLRVKLARFLDLDPPTAYSCVQDTTDGHQPIGPCLGSNSTFGADANRGSKVANTYFKLTMADDSPGGTAPYPMGRGALMMRDFAQDGGSEFVITGATPAAAGTGKSSITPEVALPDGDHINGTLLPSHLDLRVRERTLYDAVRNSEHQRQYLQVDARTDDPLSATFRLNEAEMGFNRAGQAVAPITLVLRNAPGRAPGVTGWTNPNFRLRTMITSPFELSEEQERNDLVDGCGTTSGSQTYDAEHDVGGAFCIRLPTPKSQWLQAQLNAQPDTDEPPARTVDAIVNRGVAEDVDPDGHPDQDVDGATTEAEIRGFADVLGGGSNGATRAHITAQVGTRLTSFNFGLKLGAAFGLAGYFSEYKTLGDLIVDLGANNVTRMRPRANTGRLRLQSHGGPSYIDTNYDAFSSWYELYTFFGGEVRLPIRSDSGGRYRHPLGVLECGTADTFNHGVSLGEVGDESFSQKYSLGLFGASDLYHPPGSLPTLSFAAFRLAASHIRTWNCAADLGDGYMSPSLPAPPFKVTGIDNQGLPEPVARITSKATELPIPDGTPDVTISSAKTVCEPVIADTLTVTSTGTLRAGRLGDTIEKTITDDDGNKRTIDVPCDGMLQIYANNVFVSAGGSISASSTRNNDALGTPDARSAGAGHTGEGGDSYAGDGGKGYGLGSGTGSGSIDPGSRGADGHVPGGRGGGVVRIDAAEQVTITGVVVANGGKPTDSTTFSTNCAAVSGGGGGSGGAIAINSPYLSIRSTAIVTARGGAGGDATYGHSGGGGGGGVISANGIVRTYNGTVNVDGGDEGSSHSNCDGAGSGDSGADDEGAELDRGATVTLDAPPDPGFYRSTSSLPRLDVRAIDSAMEFETEYGFVEEGVGIEEVYVCMRYEPPGAPGGITSRQLSPPEGASEPSELDSAACQRLEFQDRTRPCPATDCNDFEFRRNISTQALLTAVYNKEKNGFPLPIFGPNAAEGVLDGFYGVYAYAVYDPTPGLTTPHVTYTSRMPNAAQARFAIDRTEPRLDVAQATDPITGCPGGTRCVNERVGHAEITATDDVSGLVSAKCNADFQGGELRDCRHGEYAFPLRDHQGFHHLTAELKDNAGYIRYINEAVRWFLDSVAPDRPEIELVHAGTQTNGWYREAPQVTVRVIDRQRSSGFVADSVVFSVDDATVGCGFDVTGSGHDPTTNECTPAELEALLPEEGRHELSAYAVDRAGNQSEASEPVLMQVDTEDPTSVLKLIGESAPPKPGQLRIFTSRPIVAFGTTDQAGGSGVASPPGRGSGVRFKIDNKGFSWWNPSDEGTIRLSDGVHQICWYAIDYAGNEEAQQCRSAIVVDSTAPVPTLGATPAAPDPLTGWYRNQVVIDPKATDAGSGVESVEMRIDGGDWVAADRIGLRDGVHEVSVRATDNAGNVSARLDETLRIDLKAPTHEAGGFPPAANEQGWFRRRPTVALRSLDGGSGPAGLGYRFAADPFGDYSNPFTVAEGKHVLSVEPRDVAGNRGSVAKADLRVDLTPPVPAIAGPAPGTVQIPLSGAVLRFSVTDNLAGTVRVRVFVLDALSRLVRTLDGGQRATGAGSVTWDGRTAAGVPALPGLYTYRVEALDAAGNSAGSTESTQFLVLVPKLLP